MIHLGVRVPDDIDPMLIKTYTELMTSKGKVPQVEHEKDFFEIKVKIKNNAEALEIKDHVEKDLHEFSAYIIDGNYLFYVFCSVCAEIVNKDDIGIIDEYGLGLHYRCEVNSGT